MLKSFLVFLTLPVQGLLERLARLSLFKGQVRGPGKGQGQGQGPGQSH